MVCRSFIFTPETRTLLNSSLTPYQFNGLRKLTTFRDHFYYDIDGGKLSVQSPFVNLSEQFTTIFCEYQLADTNYVTNLFQSEKNSSMNERLQQLDVQDIIKYLTYIIWTDKARSGYLESKCKDNTIFLLLGRLEQLLA
ncbi:MAG: hypothetical protein JWN76_3547 [Chitinophagaceae bacterium]|nr:hypothetical protein [Chitinophagaceae bacterium]